MPMIASNVTHHVTAIDGLYMRSARKDDQDGRDLNETENIVLGSFCARAEEGHLRVQC